MHAIFLTFDYAGDAASLTRIVDTYMGPIAWDYGVLSSTWLNDGPTAGALYVFQSVDAAERFLRSPNMRALTAHRDVSDFFVRHFSTLATSASALPANLSTLRTATIPPAGASPVWADGADLAVDQPA